jgi:hypothetical protein
MNIITKKSALNLAIFSVLTLNGAISALAGTVGGQIYNKSQSGWKLTVASSNISKLVRGSGGTTGATYFATRLSLGESAVGQATTAS